MYLFNFFLCGCSGYLWVYFIVVFWHVLVHAMLLFPVAKCPWVHRFEHARLLLACWNWNSSVPEWWFVESQSLIILVSKGKPINNLRKKIYIYNICICSMCTICFYAPWGNVAMQKRGSLLRAARVAQLRGVERSTALCAVWRWKVGQLCYCCAVACCGVKNVWNLWDSLVVNWDQQIALDCIWGVVGFVDLRDLVVPLPLDNIISTPRRQLFHLRSS